MSLSLTVSVNIVLTGFSGAGKTEQAKRVFDACTPAGSYPFRPMLVITCEASTSGTMGAVLDHKDCTVVRVDSLAEFEAALGRIEGGHRAGYDDGNLLQHGQPFRSVFFDGWTALVEGSKGDARALALEEDGGKKTLSGTSRQNDERVMSKAAGAEARVALRLWSGIAATHPGLLMLSTAHAGEKWMPKPGSKQGERIQVGERLDLPPLAARWLMNGTNLCIYFGRALVDADTLEDLDTVEPEQVAPSYYALTRAVTIGGYQYDLIKWQDGVITAPVKWNDPDLGAALLGSPLLIRHDTPKSATKPATPPV